MHPEKLHCLLLQQLEALDPEVSALSPQELLLELHALQAEAWYGRGSGGDCVNVGGGGTGITSAGGSGGGRGGAEMERRHVKPLGDKTEDFLVEQVGYGRGGLHFTILARLHHYLGYGRGSKIGNVDACKDKGWEA